MYLVFYRLQLKYKNNGQYKEQNPHTAYLYSSHVNYGVLSAVV